jgi:lipoate-protein ligase A
MTWRVVNSGTASAAMNMAMDEAMLLAHSTGNVPPTIRFYAWQPAAVSIGYFQKAAAEIDLNECKRQEIDVVRRLTGGRAVLHDCELTYSLVVKEDYPSIPATITASYFHFSRGLVEGLKQLGVEAEMSMPRGAYGQRSKVPSSAACFDAPAHYELTYERRKLVGSAQVRKQGVILQHGSILIRFSAEKMAAILKMPSAEMRERTRDMLSHRATCLEEILGRSVSWQEVYSVLPGSFAAALGIDIEAGELSAQERETAAQLAAVKYSNDNWNLRR